MTYQPGQSSRDMLNQLAFNRLNQDQSDDKLGNAMLIDLVTTTVTVISTANDKASAQQPKVLKNLEDLGYDKSSDLARNHVSNSNAIAHVLVRLANAAATIAES